MIEIFVQSRYRADRKKLRQRISSFLRKIGIDPEVYTVSVAIVGDRKMAEIHKKYAGKTGTTPVLAFILDQGKLRAGHLIDKRYAENVQHMIDTPGPSLLGEVIISYPQTLIFASDENKLVDTKLGEFAEHGLTNLLKAS